MRPGRPSFTAQYVARIRSGLDRPELASGDAAAEGRLYRSLGRSVLSNWMTRSGGDFKARMDRRTAFFDRETLDAIARGVTQIVIVGAGYDGRALRFAHPDTAYFEVDHPATQADKRMRLAGLGDDAATCATFVPCDLVTDDLAAALAAAGHDDGHSSLFIAEGLLGYLPRETVSSLLATLRRLATTYSRLAAAFPTERALPSRRAALRYRSRGLVVAAVGEPRVTRFAPGEVEGVFGAAGWRVAVDGDVRRYHQGHSGALAALVPDV
jgi:methyltransferase (TIGR00027 family)